MSHQELPRDCDGCEPADGSNDSAIRRPSHVRAGGFKGVYTLGTYRDEAPNTTGSWHPLPQYDNAPPDPEQPQGEPLPIDLGGPTSYYASKSFYDSAKHRRLVWAWIRLGGQALEAFDEDGRLYEGFHAGGCPGIGSVMTNCNSMPREVTYDPQLQRLNFFPIPELAALRGAVLGSVPPHTAVAPGAPVTLTTDPGVLQSEMRVAFALPTESLRVGVTLLANSHGGRTVIYIDFVPKHPDDDEGLVWNVTAGVDQASFQCPNYVRREPPPSLTNRTACPTHNATLPLKATDRSLDIAVWSDNLFLEIFLMGGRLAFTVPLPCEAIVGGAGATAFVEGGRQAKAERLNATIWRMGGLKYENTGAPDNRS